MGEAGHGLVVLSDLGADGIRVGGEVNFLAIEGLLVVGE